MGGMCSIFADDTTTYTMGKDPVPTCHDLSVDLDLACDWALRCGMLFSAEKSEHLLISSRKTPTLSPGVSMGRTCVPEVMSHKHLEVHFNNRLAWVTHIDEVH